jgi:hypothetical protein
MDPIETGRLAAGGIAARVVDELRARPLAVVGGAFALGVLVGASLRSTTARTALVAVGSRVLERAILKSE